MTVHPKPGFQRGGDAQCAGKHKYFTLSSMWALGFVFVDFFRGRGIQMLISCTAHVFARARSTLRLWSGRVLSSPRNLQPEKYHKIVPKVKTLFLGDLVKTARK